MRGPSCWETFKNAVENAMAREEQVCDAGEQALGNQLLGKKDLM